MSFYAQMYPHLQLLKDKHLLWVTLDNTEQSNAISMNVVESLTTVLRFADFDSDVRVIILTGAGNCFCAGGDIKAMEQKIGMFQGESNELRLRYMNGIQQIPLVIESMSTPLLAMVNGAAIGAGCDLSMMCDLRIGSAKSKFGETFVKLGLVPGDGGSFFLQRVIGFSRAMQMSLTGDIIEGEEALKWGLLNYLVEESALKEETEKIALKIAENAPIAVQMTKKTMKSAYRNELQTVLDLAAAYQGISQRTEDHFTALSGMKEKKKVTFSSK